MLPVSGIIPLQSGVRPGILILRRPHAGADRLGDGTFLFGSSSHDPEELAEASRIDGAGPMRFFFDVVLPLSKTSMAALFVSSSSTVEQYLWPCSSRPTSRCTRVSA